MIVLASLCLLLTPQVTPAQFKTMIDRAEKSDAAIPAALEALSEAALRTGFDLKAYQKAVGDPFFSTSPRRLAVERARKGDVEVVGVTIGMWSRVRARNAKTGELDVPTPLKFIERYDAVPLFVGRSLVIMQTSIQDAGIRFGYRAAFLSPESKRLKTTGKFSGTWTLSELPLAMVVKGPKLIFQTLEEPSTFFTANYIRLFHTTYVWDLTASQPRLQSVTQGDKELRSVDRWIETALAAKRPTKGQVEFRKQWGTERPMLEAWGLHKENDLGEVTLETESNFRFRISPKGVVSFLGASKRSDLPQ